MIYPEDANGIVLRRIAAQGKDLTKARNIDFTVIFAQPERCQSSEKPGLFCAKKAYQGNSKSR